MSAPSSPPLFKALVTTNTPSSSPKVFLMISSLSLGERVVSSDLVKIAGIPNSCNRLYIYWLALKVKSFSCTSLLVIPESFPP